MSDTPMQVIVAAFSSPDTATRVLDELKQGKKAGLVGLVDVGAIVKDADGKHKVTDARQEPTREGASSRLERDLLGEREVLASAYYGIHTLRALENFPITGVPISIYLGLFGRSTL